MIIVNDGTEEKKTHFKRRKWGLFSNHTPILSIQVVTGAEKLPQFLPCMSMKKWLLLSLFFCQQLSGQTIRIATYQYADNPRTRNLQPLADHLSRSFGWKTEVKSYPTVPAFIEAIQKGEVDIAFINTFGYLLLETSNKPYPMKAALVMVTPDSVKANYQTAFVSSLSSGIRSWKDVAEKAAQSRLALVFAGSTSGNLVPRLSLTGIGITDAEKSFRSVFYAGTHVSALEQVLKDSAELAAMGSNEYEKLTPEMKKKINLVALSPEIPLGPALISTTLEKTIQKNIEQALLNLATTDKSTFDSLKSAWSEAKQANRFILLADHYYQPFLQHFGNKEQIYPILKMFAN